jgi:hypothetical protein
MSERIVLTPDEWARLATGDFYGSGDGGVYVGAHTGGDMEVGHRYHALVALANAALPDTDPRKITRERVKALRAAAFALREQPLGVSDDWRHMDATWANLGGAQRARHEASALALSALAAALESYLPPADADL